MRRIWLCADDYGISDAVDLAIRDLVVRGRLNAASVLVASPHCHRSETMMLAALNSAAPRAALGLHVALTAPFRPMSRDFQPSEHGAFLPLPATIKSAFLRRFDPDLLAAEIAAQMHAFFGMVGRAPDFIDGHHHVQLLPQIRDAVLSVAKTASPSAWLRQCGSMAPFTALLADRKGFFLDVLSRTFRQKAKAVGLRTNPAFAGTYAFSGEADFSTSFARFLDRLPDGGVVMCHPGFVDIQLERLDSLTALREREYAFLASGRFPALLAAHAVTLQPV
jgi:predicted glycoside hydrolase/deacetylase ChbG (UPF0249 family)